jgi:hypothetical protein
MLKKITTMVLLVLLIATCGWSVEQLQPKPCPQHKDCNCQKGAANPAGMQGMKNMSSCKNGMGAMPGKDCGNCPKQGTTLQPPAK